MEMSAKLPRQRGNRLVLYAVTTEEQQADSESNLKLPDSGYARRGVSGWWDDRLPFGADIPELTEPAFVSGRQLVKALEARYAGVTVTLHMGPRAAWRTQQERRRTAWEEAKAKRPPLPPDTERLIHALSPECMICHKTVRKLEIAHLLDWPTIRRAVETHPSWLRSDHDMRRAALMFHDPWNMGVLCRDHVHHSGCHDRQEAGQIALEQLLQARASLDQQPGAERLYGRFLDQSLTEERRRFGLDMNAMGRVLMLLSRATKGGEPSPYVLKHGTIKVDREQGGLSWGQHDCTDGH
ncbi:hypothetical protein [Streptomyces sp. NBC_00057]|uniref:hypothetical protein n=1 Tax=Streptomyces sp. NBC_00057 TaxID=2975634 RepID=UPI00324512AC